MFINKKEVLIVLIILLAGLAFFTIQPLLTGITVLDTTVDLSNYPDLFVKDGVFDGLMVVGENSQALDVLAMTDIASSMKIIEKLTTEVSGDAWKVSSGNNVLEVANSDASYGTIQGENLYDITRYIGKNELRGLAEGIYKTRTGSYSYNQYLYFDVDNTGTNELVKYAENEDDVSNLFFFLDNGKNIGQYKLEFASSAKSDIYDSGGSISTSGKVLRDFENTQINLFGTEYVIVLARRPQSEDSIKLTLMGGVVSGSIIEGEKLIYQLDETSYEVSLTYVDDTHVKFSVNGESTSKLRVGDIYKLGDGKEIGLTDNLYQNYAGGVHSASFFLGADKLILRDDDVTDDASDSELIVDGETIDGADVIITGSDDNIVFTLNTIVISMTAQSDYYVGANEKLSDVIKSAGDNPKLLFINNWDLEFKGLSEAKSHEIKLASTTSRKYKLVFYDGKENKVNLPLFYAVDDDTISFGEESNENCLFLTESLGISKNDYFVVTGGSASSGSAVSFALQYKGADASSSSSPKIKFKDLGSKNTLEYLIDTSSTAAGSSVANIKLGGYTFKVISNQAKTIADFQIRVSLDGGATVGTDTVNIVDYYGTKISFGSIPSSGDCRNTSVSSSTITITTGDSGDYNGQTPAEIVLVADATTGSKVTISSFTVGGTSNPLLSDGDVAYGYTSMGGKITYTSPSGSPNTFTYDYPKKQRLPQLYITSKAITSLPGGKLVHVTIFDATRLDNEIADTKAQNLIVIGGPCINSIAAEVLGNKVDCLEGFTPGKARIKLFENNGKLVLLVAGYGKNETRLASKVIAYRWAELSGKEVEITGTTYSDAVITKLS